jgi:hypothetical protein
MPKASSHSTLAKKATGRKAGKPNYKAKILLSCVQSVLPAGHEEWKLVAESYRGAAQEAEVRDPSDLKRHFHSKLCNGGKKPTGKSGSDLGLKHHQRNQLHY